VLRVANKVYCEGQLTTGASIMVLPPSPSKPKAPLPDSVAATFCSRMAMARLISGALRDGQKEYLLPGPAFYRAPASEGMYAFWITPI
jgi:hypothetical protein